MIQTNYLNHIQQPKRQNSELGNWLDVPWLFILLFLRGMMFAGFFLGFVGFRRF